MRVQIPTSVTGNGGVSMDFQVLHECEYIQCLLVVQSCDYSQTYITRFVFLVCIKQSAVSF